MSADEIAKLAQLKEKGLISDDEFAAQKAKLLGAGGQPPSGNAGPVSRKSRGTALILAIVPGGIWTWAYSMKVDKIKFIVGLIVSAVSGGFGIPLVVIFWIWAIIDAARRDQAFYDRL